MDDDSEVSIKESRICSLHGVRRKGGVYFFFFFFFYSHLTPHSPTGMAGGKDYAGAHRAKASTYKGAAIPTPRATTTDPDKVLTQKEKQTTP